MRNNEQTVTRKYVIVDYSLEKDSKHRKNGQPNGLRADDGTQIIRENLPWLGDCLEKDKMAINFVDIIDKTVLFELRSLQIGSISYWIGIINLNMQVFV